FISQPVLPESCCSRFLYFRKGIRKSLAKSGFVIPVKFFQPFRVFNILNDERFYVHFFFGVLKSTLKNKVSKFMDILQIFLPNYFQGRIRKLPKPLNLFIN